MQSTVGMLLLGGLGKFALLILNLEALLTSSNAHFRWLTTLFTLYWTTPCAWSRGYGGCKFLKGILFLFYKSTEMTT